MLAKGERSSTSPTDRRGLLAVRSSRPSSFTVCRRARAARVRTQGGTPAGDRTRAGPASCSRHPCLGPRQPRGRRERRRSASHQGSDGDGASRRRHAADGLQGNRSPDTGFFVDPPDRDRKGGACGRRRSSRRRLCSPFGILSQGASSRSFEQRLHKARWACAFARFTRPPALARLAIFDGRNDMAICC